MNGHAKSPKYLRVISEDTPQFDKIIEYRPEFASVNEGDEIDIDTSNLVLSYCGSGTYRIVKIRNDLLHDYFWVEKVPIKIGKYMGNAK